MGGRVFTGRTFSSFLSFYDGGNGIEQASAGGFYGTNVFLLFLVSDGGNELKKV